MSAPLDVLAVIHGAQSAINALYDYAERRSRKQWCESADEAMTLADENDWGRLAEAHAAVAELVSAAEGVALFAFDPKDMVRLRAALAKFGAQP